MASVMLEIRGVCISVILQSGIGHFNRDVDSVALKRCRVPMNTLGTGEA